MGNYGMGEGQGDGLGEGQGEGFRPEQETDTGTYLSKVRAKPRAGEAVRTGEVGGPNRAGISREGLKEEILSTSANDADPLTDQRLPKSQKEHIRDYIKRLNDGE